jgi:regulator of sigma E protease
MSTLLGSLLSFIVAISVLVAVHEFGHYIVGRWCGMKVLRFSIGFGKPLWTRVAGRDRTEYCISTIPLGGYVKFLDEREGPVDPADQGRAFTHRPVPQRIAVLLAGPLFNFLFAIVAYWALFVSGIPTLVPQVGQVTPGSYAEAAGLEYGDRILRIGERDTGDWETALVAILDDLVSDGRVAIDVVSDDGNRHSALIEVGDDAARLTEPGMLFEGLGFAPAPWQPPAVVGSVDERGAAAAAGIVPGDRIVAIAGEQVDNFADLQWIVAQRPDEAVPVTVLRDGAEVQLTVTLGSREVEGRRLGFMGVGVATGDDHWYVRKFGPIDSVGPAIERTWTSTGFTLRMLMRMVTGDVSVRNISGPIQIAQYAGESAASGINAFLSFLAIVSISLGVLNLLPIPLLDGGQIVYQSVEMLKGSPLSERSQIVGQQVGIFALLLLMSFAFYNDIARIFGQ